MNYLLLYGGALIAAFGCVETVVAVRSDLPRSMLAQGVFFVELGLAFIAQTVLPEGVMRASVATAFAISAIVTATVQYKLQRTERRERRRRLEGDAHP